MPCEPDWHRRMTRWFRQPRHRALGVALLMLGVLLTIWWLAGRWYQDRLLREARAQITEEASLHAGALSLAITRRVALLQGLYAYIQTEEASDRSVGDTFETFAAELYAGARGVNYLAAAPGGVIRFVYPVGENSIYLGQDLINDPRTLVRADVERAIRLRLVTVSAPYELLTGEQGIAARLAVYRGEEFWGLVVLALDVPPLLEEAGVNDLSDDLTIALRDRQGHIFFGDPMVFASDPVLQPIELPDRTWDLAAVPVGGWQKSVAPDLQVYQIGGLTVVVLLAGLVYLGVMGQIRAVEQAQQMAIVHERQRIARELHDSVSQALYGISLGAHTARERLNTQPALAQQPLDYLLSLAEAALAEMRALIFELRPDSLEAEGLVAALEKQVEAIRLGHRLDLHVEFSGEPDLPLAAKEAIFRIAQEALNNVAKHARAHRVDLSLRQIGERTVFCIQDDGKGFDPDAAYPGHLGLKTMHERAEQVKGELRIASLPGEGTRLTLIIMQ